MNPDNVASEPQPEYLQQLLLELMQNESCSPPEGYIDKLTKELQNPTNNDSTACPTKDPINEEEQYPGPLCYTCDKCYIFFALKELYELHQNKHHNENQLIFCDICFESFHHEILLKAHKQCKICKERTALSHE